ncbi:unnamed protein product [Cyclocybe aegerita]|uniref:Uncharacterized protein n=1 Tax=Cyclocybe aegerita TaxID=1973307 RepID=A0A8S0VXD7_CYCAE|nr:unnamed protein product [Cyclocybe aegerita]
MTYSQPSIYALALATTIPGLALAMPSLTTTVKDTSPLLIYTGNWRPGNSATDPLASRYLESSFTFTQGVGQSMIFQFYGSFVEVVGAKRHNHGDYTIQVDNQTFTGNGFSDSEIFNTTLYSQTLDLGQHTLVATNVGGNGGQFFDIDYVTFRSDIGETDEPLIVNTFQDYHPSFNFSPPSSWRDQLNPFPGMSGRSTSDMAASARLSFQGASPTESFPTVSDEIGQEILSHCMARPRQILFFAANLGSGLHSLVIKPEQADGILGIDSANVYTTPSLGGSFSPGPVAGPDATSASVPGANTLPQDLSFSRIPRGAIAGLCFTTLIAFFSTAGFLYLLWTQRRQRCREAAILKRNTEPYPFTSNPPTVGYTVTRVPSHPPVVQRSSESGNRPSNSSGHPSGGFDPALLTSRRPREIPRPPSSSIEGGLALPPVEAPPFNAVPPATSTQPRKITLRLHSSMQVDEESEIGVADPRPTSTTTQPRRSARQSLDLTR